MIVPTQRFTAGHFRNYSELSSYGQRIDAATGAEIGADFRISDVGPDGNASYDAYAPAVAYNSAEDEYLVVWESDDNTGGLVDEEYEIFGQRFAVCRLYLPLVLRNA